MQQKCKAQCLSTHERRTAAFTAALLLLYCALLLHYCCITAALLHLSTHERNNLRIPLAISSVFFIWRGSCVSICTFVPVKQVK
jgi:hypothetical protein